MPRRLVHDLAQRLEPGRAREQGRLRLEGAHVGREGVPLAGRDVGRVRDHHLEQLVGAQRLEPVAPEEAHAAREPE